MRDLVDNEREIASVRQQVVVRQIRLLWLPQGRVSPERPLPERLNLCESLADPGYDRIPVWIAPLCQHRLVWQQIIPLERKLFMLTLICKNVYYWTTALKTVIEIYIVFSSDCITFLNRLVDDFNPRLDGCELKAISDRSLCCGRTLQYRFDRCGRRGRAPLPQPL